MSGQAAKDPSFQQGDIVIVDLEPAIGDEQKKRRHCLVLNSISCPRNIVLVAPFIRQPASYKDFAAWMPFIPKTDENGLDEDRIVDVFQTRAVSVERIKAKTSGKLTQEQLKQISKALAFITRV